MSSTNPAGKTPWMVSTSLESFVAELLACQALSRNVA